MTTLYHFASPVKTRPLGRGILRSVPAVTADHTASDEAWLVTDNARREDAHFDRMAAESAALDAQTNGYVFA
jgi:hypothetical protein